MPDDKKEKPCPKEGEIIQGKYEVVRQLGEGGFGAVYEVIEVNDKEHYAMKLELEKQPVDEPGLDLEAAVLKRLQGYNHILRYVDEGEWGEQKLLYMVMQLAGPSLASLRKQSNHKKFTCSTSTRLAMQTLAAIETVHVAGLLHRDVKPGNFAIGKNDNDKRIIFILDFGLVRKYLTAKGKIRSQRSSAGFRGSIQYASINAHRNVDLGRVDDIWCWLYMMVQLCVGKLPWRNLNGKNKVGEKKMKTTKAELLKGMEPEYQTIYDTLMKLKYEDEPSYRTFQEYFSRIMKRRNITVDEQFDWEKDEESSERRKVRSGTTKTVCSDKTERSKIDTSNVSMMKPAKKGHIPIKSVRKKDAESTQKSPESKIAKQKKEAESPHTSPDSKIAKTKKDTESPHTSPDSKIVKQKKEAESPHTSPDSKIGKPEKNKEIPEKKKEVTEEKKVVPEKKKEVPEKKKEVPEEKKKFPEKKKEIPDEKKEVSSPKHPSVVKPVKTVVKTSTTAAENVPAKSASQFTKPK